MYQPLCVSEWIKYSSATMPFCNVSIDCRPLKPSQVFETLCARAV
jgi:hypothetical protein